MSLFSGSLGRMGAQSKEQKTVGYRLANSFLRAITAFIRLLDGSARKHLGWDPYLKGHWKPVHSEVHAQGLEIIEGELPGDLGGAFVRTGPNPKLTPAGGYHLFDGDGMIHAVKIDGGKVAYCNRWVRTARLAQEEKAGWPVAAKIGDYRGLASLGYMLVARLAKALGVLSTKDGLGTANTAVAYHAGQVLALHEGDLPYAMRITCNGLVETMARTIYEGKIEHPFTAHPKVDLKTGELFYFGYNVRKKPHCWYGRLDASGHVVADFPVPLPEPIMMHDMALTQNYVILLDVPLVFDPKSMIRKGQLPFEFKDRPARIGVLPRYAKSADEIRWFPSERWMCFHTAAAWEEGSKVRLYLCTMKDFSLDQFTASKDAEPHMSEVVIDLEAGTTAFRRLPGATPGDFPVVPAHLVGQPARYSYVAAMEANDTGVPVFIGITKYDLQAGGNNAVAGTILHGAKRMGGEAFFVPQPGATAEDAGYLVTIVTDEESLQSELVVYDATTMVSKPLARVRMPQRVPSGFHCTFVTAEQLAAQLS